MVGKLGKYFARVGADEKTPVEDKVKDSEDLCAKAERRVRKTAEGIKKEVEEYRADLETRERAAVEKAQQAVGELVSKAQEELGTGWTWCVQMIFSARDSADELASQARRCDGQGLATCVFLRPLTPRGRC